jgi:murein DD-endopeptidase MepM/ murein hydrolase activator NlpD
MMMPLDRRRGSASRLVAASAAATVLVLSGLTGPALAQVKVPAGSATFMTFPSSDPAVKLGQAWYYEAHGLKDTYCSYPGGDVSGYGRHCSIDYRKRTSSGNVTFPVVTVAAGLAYRSSASSGTITVEHDQTDPSGRKFCTRYVHLDTNRQVIPVGIKTRVAQGQQIAWAGKTGTRSIHLHLDTRVGGCGGTRVDPYDIATGLLDQSIPPVKIHYPGGSSFKGCGPNSLWEECVR